MNVLDLVPAPRQWSPASGQFTLPAAARLVADPGTVAAVRRLVPELRTATGLALPLADDPARPGDLAVRINPEGAAAPGGYSLEFTDAGTVTGADPAGAFYGLQTVLKLLCGAPDRRSLPCGIVHDWPATLVRGAMLDLGRRYWSLDYLREFVRNLAWLGGNRLQLHLTEWNAFRVLLDDPRFADLAAPESYTAAQLRELIAQARELHVDVVPEIDLPAHASAITQRHPELRFTGPGADAANSGAQFTGQPTHGWTIDITRPANRAWVRDLLTAFATELDTSTVHIGADEWQEDEALSRCTALVNYARDLDPTYRPTDALNAFVNDLVALLAGLGRSVELWSWWEIAAGDEIRVWPDRSARVTAWPSDPAGLGFFLDHGYRVLASPMATHYVTPCAPPGNRPHDPDHRVPDPRWLHERWEPPRAAGLDGYQLCVWADHATDQSDEYFDWHLRRPLQAMLDRLWGGPRRASADDFFDAVDAQPLPSPSTMNTRLTGTPGTSQGHVSVVLPEPARLTRVRIRPAAPVPPTDAPTGRWPADAHERLDALIGGRIQGAADPAGPWNDLATVAWQPAPVWTELTVRSDIPVRAVRWAPSRPGVPAPDLQCFGLPAPAPALTPTGGPAGGTSSAAPRTALGTDD